MMTGVEEVAVSPSAFTAEEIDQIRLERENDAAQIFAIARAQIAPFGLAHETCLLVGDPHDEILEKGRWVDLLAIGKRSAGGGEHGVGRLAQDIIRHAAQPVLVAERFMDPPAEIVVLFDGSDRGLHALRLGTELALASELPLAVLTGAETLDQARRINNHALAYLADHDVAGQALLVHQEHTGEARTGGAVQPDGGEPAGGSIDDKLVVVLKDRMRALVVMGAFGAPRLAEWIRGSTTRTILKELDCPVLLVAH
jgi:nucleotide-binding universal stress UspA family protein